MRSVSTMWRGVLPMLGSTALYLLMEGRNTLSHLFLVNYLCVGLL